MEGAKYCATDSRIYAIAFCAIEVRIDRKIQQAKLCQFLLSHSTIQQANFCQIRSTFQNDILSVFYSIKNT